MGGGLQPPPPPGYATDLLMSSVRLLNVAMVRHHNVEHRRDCVKHKVYIGRIKRKRLGIRLEKKFARKTSCSRRSSLHLSTLEATFLKTLRRQNELVCTG